METVSFDSAEVTADHPIPRLVSMVKDQMQEMGETLFEHFAVQHRNRGIR